MNRRQQGVALPVMLIILAVMLVGAIYVFRASNSTTLAATNLANDAAYSRVADLGLHTAFEWLSATADSDKAALNADDAAHGYKATLDTTQTVATSGFWDGSATVTVTDAGNHAVTIEYVIHRMCALPGAYDSGTPLNTCMQTPANTATLNNQVALGDSLASDTPSFAGSPQLHYVITARLRAVRGGNVINQMVVMIGA